MLTKLFRLAILTLVLPSAVWAEGPLQVVATTRDLASLVQEIGGDDVRVKPLSKGYQNPHFVDAKPSLIVKAMKADMFVLTGLDLEIGWASLVLQGSRNKKILPGGKGYVDASYPIEAIEIPVNPTRAMGDVHPGGNPHYMADPENVLIVAAYIKDRLVEARPSGKKQFEARLGTFEKKMRSKITEWKNKMKPYKGKTFVSYHKTWSYFAKYFGLVSLGEIEPKPGIPPTASHTNDLINRMKPENTKLILASPWFEKRSQKFIAEKTGASMIDMALFPGVRPEINSIIDCFDYNVDSLVKAFQ